jgi:hypothetical protein
MTEQEIKAKALEITVQMFSLLPPDVRMKFLSGDNNKMQQNIINTSKIFEDHIRGVNP